ncbi:hypothetical protein EJ03DRAFT_108768 [Teratosphaeria nubilosa]|uniref:Uncharacterized protein n=1 Tax=Teratosphaeria nubilosa TaxID=161662 RepID=A0A6G1L7U4_9PEZI|nr:hypothetical protein EJ03DRAFT_108768 [Teratosphaeria nubilosa]
MSVYATKCESDSRLFWMCVLGDVRAGLSRLLHHGQKDHLRRMLDIYEHCHDAHPGPSCTGIQSLQLFGSDLVQQCFALLATYPQLDFMPTVQELNASCHLTMTIAWSFVHLLHCFMSGIHTVCSAPSASRRIQVSTAGLNADQRPSKQGWMR